MAKKYQSKKNGDLIEANEDLNIKLEDLQKKYELLEDKLQNFENSQKELQICGNCHKYRYVNILNNYVCDRTYKVKIFNECCKSWSNVNVNIEEKA